MRTIEFLGGMSWQSMAVYVTAAVARGAAALAAGPHRSTAARRAPPSTLGGTGGY